MPPKGRFEPAWSGVSEELGLRSVQDALVGALRVIQRSVGLLWRLGVGVFVV